MRETETVPTNDDATPARRTGAPEPLSLSDYPESDGKPMAETPIHWHATVDAAQPLQEFYRDRADVYVGSDMMMYYREGDIRACVSPDVFVAFEAPKLPERRVWRTWVEGKLADFVLEITSLGTRRVDEVTKKALYAELGIREYWQFDPEGDYLEPMLQGRRLGSDGEYRTLVLEQRNGALCHGSLLGLELRLEGERLRFFDPRRGEYLLTSREKEEALRGTESVLRGTEETLRGTEAALRAARAENADLRRRLDRRGK